MRRALCVLALLLASCEDRTACEDEIVLLSADALYWYTCPADADLEVIPISGVEATVVVCGCPAERP